MATPLLCGLLLLVALVLPPGLLAQVLPPTESSGSLPFPVTECVNTVGVGLTAQGILTCAPVMPAMVTGLVPSGVDVTASGQVIATHLAAPLPPAQGGLGLTTGTAGGLLYFLSTEVLASSPVLTLNAPLFGGGPGAPPQPGLRSGTTLEVATVLGPHTVGKQLAFDPLGNVVATAADIGGTVGAGGSVVSVFGRQGAVQAQAGDYTAAQILNAVDLLSANVFAHPSGQTMPRLVLAGTLSGTLSLRPPAVAGTSLLTFPAGILDMTTTGGPGYVLKQGSAGGPLTVGPVAFTDLTGTGDLCTTASVCAGYQAVLGFTPEDVSQKSLSTDLGTSNSLYPSQNAVKVYVDTGLATKQGMLGFTAENVANKATATGLGTSNVLYPTQAAVKSYVDTGLATKQASLGYTAESTANKATSITLGTSDTLYPTQHAVKVYVDTGLATKQDLLAFTPENVAQKATGTSLGTSDLLYPSQNAVKVYVDTGLATKQNTLGFTPETVANKATGTLLGTSNVLYPTQNAVKSYVDTGLAAKQATLGFTPENVTNKATSTALGTSDTLYPSQAAVKGYVDTGLATKQATLGFTPENLSNKAIGTSLGTSDLLYPSQNAVKMYVDTGLAAKQNLLGFTAEDVANKATATGLGTSDTAYPSQKAVKSYVDMGLAGKQASLGFTPENVTNKSTATGLGTSDASYPSQNAVKSYVDTGLALREVLSNKSPAPTLGTSNTLYPTQQAVKSYVDTVSGTLVPQARTLTAGFGMQPIGDLSTNRLIAFVAPDAAAQVYVSDSITAGTWRALPHCPDTGGQHLNYSTATHVFVCGTSGVGGGGDVTSVETSSVLGQLTVFAGTTGKVLQAYEGTAGLVKTNASGVASPAVAGTDYATPAAVAAKQDAITWGAGLSSSGVTAAVASTEAGFLTSGGGASLSCGAGMAGRAQVMASGEIQYCGGEATPGLHAGLPTQSGLTWNIIPGTCTGDPNGGKLTLNGVQIVCGSDAAGGGGGSNTFNASDFNVAGVDVSLDYANGQAASAANKGYLTSADWTTFTAKQAALTWGAGLDITGTTPRLATQEAGSLFNGGGTNLTAGAGQGGKLQVLTSGALQYTGYEATPLLHSGYLLPLPPAITPATCTTDPQGGKLTVLAGQIVCAADQGGSGGGSGDTVTATSLATSVYVGDTSLGHCTFSADGLVIEAACDAAKTTLFTSDIMLFASGPMELRNADGDSCATTDNVTGLVSYHTTNACQRPSLSRPFDATAFNAGPGVTVDTVAVNGWPGIPILDGPDSDAGAFSLVIPVLWRDFADAGQMTLQLTCHSAALQDALTLIVRVGVPVCTATGTALPGFVAPTSGTTLTCTFGATAHDIQMSNIVTLSTTGCAAGQRMDIPFVSEADMTAGWSTTTAFITGGLLTYETVGTP